MPNISLKGEDVFLEGGKNYFVMDALYLDEVKENINTIDVSNIEDEIRKKIFPYTESPFMEINFPRNKTRAAVFKVSNIKKGSDEDNIKKCFSSDTGLIIFIEKSILTNFIAHFDYNDLVDSATGVLININYWEAIERKFGLLNCGLILSPGINKGFDFEGSGFYKIKI